MLVLNDLSVCQYNTVADMRCCAQERQREMDDMLMAQQLGAEEQAKLKRDHAEIEVWLSHCRLCGCNVACRVSHGRFAGWPAPP